MYQSRNVDADKYNNRVAAFYFELDLDFGFLEQVGTSYFECEGGGATQSRSHLESMLLTKVKHIL